MSCYFFPTSCIVLSALVLSSLFYNFSFIYSHCSSQLLLPHFPSLHIFRVALFTVPFLSSLLFCIILSVLLLSSFLFYIFLGLHYSLLLFPFHFAYIFPFIYIFLASLECSSFVYIIRTLQLRHKNYYTHNTSSAFHINAHHDSTLQEGSIKAPVTRTCPFSSSVFIVMAVSQCRYICTVL